MTEENFTTCPRCNGVGTENAYKNQPKDVFGCCLIMCCSCRGTGKVTKDHAKLIKDLGLMWNGN